MTNTLNPLKPEARRMFDMGYGHKRTAAVLGLNPYTVRDWFRAFRREKERLPATDMQK